MRGVRLNTDAIDNSAGVNTSDVEVNIKIALTPADARRAADARGARHAARRDDRRGRPRWCCATTTSRRWRSRSPQRRGLEDLGFQQRLMQTLEARGAARPRGRVPARRHGARRAAPARAGADAAGARRAARLRQARALRRPARIAACRTIPISAASWRAISRSQLVERFPDALEQHRLRREIIATQLANSMINRGGPSLVGAHRRPDRRVRAGDRGRVLRGAQQLRHDRAQQRDRCARQQGRRQAAARSLRGGAGPAARPHGLVPAQRRFLARASPTSSSTIAPASRRSRPRSTTCCREDARSARAARVDRTDERRRAGRAGAPHRQPAGRSPPRPTSCSVADRTGKAGRRCGGDLLRGRRVLPARPHRERRARHPGHRLFRPARARPRARLDRRGGAPPHRRDGRRRRDRRRRRSTPGSSRAPARSSASAPRCTASQVRG